MRDSSWALAPSTMASTGGMAIAVRTLLGGVFNLQVEPDTQVRRRSLPHAANVSFPVGSVCLADEYLGSLFSVCLLFRPRLVFGVSPSASLFSLSLFAHSQSVVHVRRVLESWKSDRGKRKKRESSGNNGRETAPKTPDIMVLASLFSFRARAFSLSALALSRWACTCP